jgi:hypothetical protein
MANSKFSLCRWVQDADGNIGLELFKILSLIKYKKRTLMVWFVKLQDAPLYVSAASSPRTTWKRKTDPQ